jgi:hypothetical protein
MYTWYYIFTSTDFLALDLVSKTYTLILDGRGTFDILVTNGQSIGITFEGVFLSLNLNDKNPFEFENYAIYIDDDDQVWLGFAVEDEE